MFVSQRHKQKKKMQKPNKKIKKTEMALPLSTKMGLGSFFTLWVWVALTLMILSNELGGQI